MGSDEHKDEYNSKKWIYLTYALVIFGSITLVSGLYYLFCLNMPSPAGTILQASALFFGAGGVSASILKYREKTVKLENKRAKIDFLNHRMNSEKMSVEHYQFLKEKELCKEQSDELDGKISDAHDKFEEIYEQIKRIPYEDLTDCCREEK